jgi:putative phosphoesterase
MRILLTADTHAKRYHDLPAVLQREIIEADAVIHAGDYGSEFFFEEFVSKCPDFYGVLGNNDSLSLPRELITELDGVRIAAIHSDGAIGDRRRYLVYKFRASSPDIIVYGHTHRACKDDLDRPLLLNPGIPTRNRGAFASYAILETNAGNFKTYIKKI